MLLISEDPAFCTRVLLRRCLPFDVGREARGRVIVDFFDLLCEAMIFIRPLAEQPPTEGSFHVQHLNTSTESDTQVS